MPHTPKHKVTRAATLADVGRAAGVSAMAASAVLNGARTSSRISEETRQRIVAAADRLSYRPNATARALVNRRMNTIGVATQIGAGDFNSYVMELFTGIIAAASAREQSTTMFALHDWDRDAHRLRGLCDGRIDGLILLAPRLSKEMGQSLPSHTPFVSVHSNSQLPNVVNIESDEERGAYDAVRALISKGHRHIIHLSGDPGFIGAERRIAGFERAMTAACLPLGPESIVSSSFTIEGGRSSMRDWLQRHAGQLLPQGIFCANDGNAIGCLEALAELGLRVPEDVSVVGFDDTLAARTTVPQLTTVRQPLREMGSRAVEVLLERIEGTHSPTAPELIVFPVDFVARASLTAPPVGPRLVPLAK